MTTSRTLRFQQKESSSSDPKRIRFALFYELSFYGAKSASLMEKISALHMVMASCVLFNG